MKSLGQRQPWAALPGRLVLEQVGGGPCGVPWQGSLGGKWTALSPLQKQPDEESPWVETQPLVQAGGPPDGGALGVPGQGSLGG